jgi:hypothetical protein
MERKKVKLMALATLNLALLVQERKMGFLRTHFLMRKDLWKE